MQGTRLSLCVGVCVSSGDSGSLWLFLSCVGNMSALGDWAHPIYPFAHNKSRQDPLFHPFFHCKGEYMPLPSCMASSCMPLMDDFRLFRFHPLFVTLAHFLSSCQHKVVSYFTVTSKASHKEKTSAGKVLSLCGSKCIEDEDLCRRVSVFLC